MKKRLEIVYWRDAHFSLSDDLQDLDDYIVKTVGWVREDGRWLRIESEQTPGGPRGVTRVPLENVVRREER